MTVKQIFNRKYVDQNTRGTVYTLRHGKGGFKASYEAIKVFHRPDEEHPFIIKFINPGGAGEVGRAKKLDTAIEKARSEAKRRMSQKIRNADYTLTFEEVDLPDFPDQ